MSYKYDWRPEGTHAREEPVADEDHSQVLLGERPCLLEEPHCGCYCRCVERKPKVVEGSREIVWQQWRLTACYRSIRIIGRKNAAFFNLRLKDWRCCPRDNRGVEWGYKDQVQEESRSKRRKKSVEENGSKNKYLNEVNEWDESRIMVMSLAMARRE